ncbi:glycoside hydrolase family 16 protein [Streptomyces sp. SP17BM10]|uniref:glycoside hydrolase family 16 protein n=1 Tax=Streptomyces sp. SP17BM10 TaxID=3002530 RepID=UPI002E76892A|nr:glycoside hydrolase family 16 protein [Streptomyces sp. SP17BM10]MEE1787356.1 glycoside hydrolase family 16 protein [Streptomyces sp. SP17BM10]
MDHRRRAPKCAVPAAALALLLTALVGCSGTGGGPAAATSAVPSAPSPPSPAASTSATPHPVLPTGIPGDWHLIFQDEFDGTSLDTSRWNVGNPYVEPQRITPPVGGQELDCYDAGQVAVRDGTLRITAVQRQQECGGKTLPYVSGMVNTKGRFSFAFGAMEARVYVPAAPDGSVANWPAFWAVGADWPSGGENDVMEGLHGKICAYFNSATASTGSCADGDLTGWHVFGAQWQDGHVDYYRDGVYAATLNQGITSDPMWLMIDNAVQPTIGGPTTVPATLMIDYVRVWQR